MKGGCSLNLSIRLLKSSCTKDHYFKQNQIVLMLKTFETNVLHPKKVFRGYDFIVKVYELDSNKFAGQI